MTNYEGCCTHTDKCLMVEGLMLSRSSVRVGTSTPVE